jgi:hypothetical protein
VRLLGLLGGDGSFALLELRTLARERPSDVGAREPLADELEMAVDLVGVIAAPHQGEGALDDEHRQRLSSRRHEALFRSRTRSPASPHARSRRYRGRVAVGSPYPADHAPTVWDDARSFNLPR